MASSQTETEAQGERVPTAVLDLLRVRQWVKNAFVLAPLFFGANLFNELAIARAASALAVFCMLSSAVYIFNDWRDIAADRAHAKKRTRPLASGRIGVRTAFGLMLLLLAGGLGVALAMRPPPLFFVIIATYLVINIGYSLGLKHVSLIELFCVSSGFVLRLLAGGVALQIELSSWIIIATGSVSLFITVGKRRGDFLQEPDIERNRRSMSGYNLWFLDAVLAAVAATTLVIYILFCVSDYAVARFGPSVLLTSILVAMGLLRYMQLLFVMGDGDAPTDLLLRDGAMMGIVGAFVLFFAILIYV